VQNELVIPAIRDGGRLALLRPWSGRTARGITAQYVSVARTNAAMKIDLLREQVEQGVITLRVAEVLPAEQAAEAHRRLEAGGVRGRLVLDFS
jgi:NADPH2:quinone reductase